MTLGGIAMLSIATSLNDFFPIIFNFEFSSNSTFTRFSHEQNAAFPISMTLDGIVISVTEDPLNAPLPII